MTPLANWLPATADVAEAVWTIVTTVGTLIAAIGAAITMTNLRAAQRANRRACAADPINQLHTDITGQALRNEWIGVGVLGLLLVTLGLFVGIGVLAIVTPDPIRQELRDADLVTTRVLVVGTLLVTAAVIAMTIGSILNRRARHRLTNRITGQLLREAMARRQTQGTS